MTDIAIGASPAHAQAIERFFVAIQAGDSATLLEVLAPDAITRWPQSGEQITGAAACIRVHASYPGGPPTVRITRILVDGDLGVAELVADYGTERWSVISICEFRGDRIARMTDYFAQAFPAPEWRRELVDPIDTEGRARPEER
jgi:ketosteroid isomerase-like protein